MEFVYTNTNGLVSFGGLSKGITDFTTQSRVLLNTGSNITQLVSPVTDAVVYYTSNGNYVWSKMSTAGFNYTTSNRNGIPTFNGSNITVIPTATSTVNLIGYSNGMYTFKNLDAVNLVAGYTNDSTPSVLFAANNVISSSKAIKGVARYSSGSAIEFGKVNPEDLNGITSNDYNFRIIVARSNSNFNTLAPKKGLVRASNNAFNVNLGTPSDLLGSNNTLINNSFLYASNDTFMAFPGVTSNADYIINYTDSSYNFIDMQKAINRNITPKILNAIAKTSGTQIIVNSSNTFNFIDSSVGYLYTSSDGTISFKNLTYGVSGYNSNNNSLIFTSGNVLYQTPTAISENILIYSSTNNSFAWNKLTPLYLSSAVINSNNNGLVFTVNSSGFNVAYTSNSGVNYIVYNSSTKNFSLKSPVVSDIVNYTANSNAQLIYAVNDNYITTEVKANNVLATDSNTNAIKSMKINKNHLDTPVNYSSSQIIYVTGTSNRFSSIPTPVNNYNYFMRFSNDSYSFVDITPNNLLQTTLNSSVQSILLSQNGSTFNSLNVPGTLNSVLTNANSSTFIFSKITQNHFNKTGSNSTGLMTIPSANSNQLQMVQFNSGVLIGNSSGTSFGYPTVSDLTGVSTNGIIYTVNNSLNFINSPSSNDDYLMRYNSVTSTFSAVSAFNSDGIIKRIKPTDMNINGVTANKVSVPVITNSGGAWYSVSGKGFLTNDGNAIRFNPLTFGISDFNSSVSGIYTYYAPSSSTIQFRLQFQEYGVLHCNKSNGMAWGSILSGDIGDTNSNAKMIYSIGNSNVLKTTNVPTAMYNVIQYNSADNTLTLVSNSSSFIDSNNSSVPRIIYAQSNKYNILNSSVNNTFLNFNNNSLNWSTISPLHLTNLSSNVSGIIYTTGNNFNTINSSVNGLLIYDTNVNSVATFSNQIKVNYLTSNSNGILFANGASNGLYTAKVSSNGNYAVTYSNGNYILTALNTAVTSDIKPGTLNQSASTGVSILYSSNNSWVITNNVVSNTEGFLKYNSSGSLEFNKLAASFTNNSNQGVLTLSNNNSIINVKKSFGLFTGNLAFEQLTSNYLSGTIGTNDNILYVSGNTFKSISQQVSKNFGLYYDSNGYSCKDLNLISTLTSDSTNNTPGVLVSQNGINVNYLQMSSSFYNVPGVNISMAKYPVIINKNNKVTADLVCPQNLYFNNAIGSGDRFVPILGNIKSGNSNFTSFCLWQGIYSTINEAKSGLFFYQGDSTNNKSMPYVSSNIPSVVIDTDRANPGAIVFSNVNSRLSWIQPPATSGSFVLNYNYTSKYYQFSAVSNTFNTLLPKHLNSSASSVSQQIMFNNNNTWGVLENASNKFLFCSSNNTLSYQGLDIFFNNYNSNYMSVLCTSGSNYTLIGSTETYSVLCANAAGTKYFGKLLPNYLNNSNTNNFVSTSNKGLLSFQNNYFYRSYYPETFGNYLFTCGNNTDPSFTTITPNSLYGNNTQEVSIVYSSNNTFVSTQLSNGLLKSENNTLNFSVLKPSDMFETPIDTGDDWIPIGSYYTETPTNSFGYLTISKGIMYSTGISSTNISFGIPQSDLLTTASNIGGIVYAASNNSLITTNTPIGGYNVINYNSTTSSITLVSFNDIASSNIKPSTFGMANNRYQLLYNNRNNTWGIFDLNPGIIEWTGSAFANKKITDYINNFNSNSKGVVIATGSNVQTLYSGSGNILIKDTTGTPTWNKILATDIYSENTLTANSKLCYVSSNQKLVQMNIPSNNTVSFVKYITNSYSLEVPTPNNLAGVNSTSNYTIIGSKNNSWTNYQLSANGVMYYNSTSGVTTKTLNARELQWGITNSNNVMVYIDSSSNMNAIGIPVNNTNSAINYNNGVYSFVQLKPSNLYNTSVTSNASLVYTKNDTWNIYTPGSNNGVIRYSSNNNNFITDTIKVNDIFGNNGTSGVVSTNSNTNSFTITSFTNGIISAGTSGISIGIPASNKILNNTSTTGPGIVYNNGNYLYSTNQVYQSGAYVSNYNSSTSVFSLTQVDSNLSRISLPIDEGAYYLNYSDNTYSWIITSQPIRYYASVAENTLFANGVIVLSQLINDLATIDYKCKLTIKYILNIPDLIDLTNSYFQSSMMFGSYDQSTGNPVFTPYQLMNTFTFNMYKVNVFNTVVYYNPSDFPFNMAAIGHMSDIAGTSLITGTNIQLNKSTITQTLKSYSIELIIERI